MVEVPWTEHWDGVGGGKLAGAEHRGYSLEWSQASGSGK